MACVRVNCSSYLSDVGEMRIETLSVKPFSNAAFFEDGTGGGVNETLSHSLHG